MGSLATAALIALFHFLGSFFPPSRAELLALLPWIGGFAAIYLGFRLLRARARAIEARWSDTPPPPPGAAEKPAAAQIAARSAGSDSPPVAPVATAGETTGTGASVEASAPPALPLPLEHLSAAPTTTAFPPALLGAAFCWTAFWAVLAFPFVKNAAVSLTGSWETIRDAPGDILGGGLKDIVAFSPYFGLALLALALGFIVCRVKAKPAAGGTFLRARLLLLLIAAIGAAISVRQIAFVADEVFRRGGVEIPADDTAFRNTMLAELSRTALFTDFGTEVTAELDAGNVERARILLAAADVLGRSVSPAVRARYKNEADFWSFNSLARNGARCFDGGIRREAETITHIACMIAVDFVPVPVLGISFGNSLDLGSQLGNHFWNDEPIDPTIAGLAAVGMAIDLLFSKDDDIQRLQPAVSVVKAGIRTSKRLKMAPRMETGLRRLAGNMFNAESVKHISPFDMRGTLARAFRKDGLTAARPVLDDLYGMYRHTGYTATPLLALKHADDLAELPHYRRMARVFGANADGVIDLIGKHWKQAFWKAGKAGARATAELAVWYASLAASLTAFLIALSTTASAWLVKRLTLRWARRKTLPPV